MHIGRLVTLLLHRFHGYYFYNLLSNHELPSLYIMRYFVFIIMIIIQVIITDDIDDFSSWPMAPAAVGCEACRRVLETSPWLGNIPRK